MENSRKYVGQRYVPKIMGEWSKSETYEGLSIVTHEGNSYTSKKRVPTGIDLSNEDFWVMTGNYNAQIEDYKQIAENTFDNLEDFKEKTDENFRLEKLITGNYVSVEEFGAIGDYNTSSKTGTDNSAAFKNAITKVTNQGGVLFIPNGNFYHSETLNYPKFVKMTGKVFGSVIFSQQKDGIYENLDIETIHIKGMWRAKMHIQHAKKVIIDGNADWHGTYWNKFELGIIDETLTIDISEGPVNQNHYLGGRITKIHITGNQTKYGRVCQAHNNWFDSPDITGGGAIQDDEKMDTNYLINAYSESVSGNNKDLIQGNWTILGHTGDTTPRTSLRNHILFTNDTIPASSQDFLSMSTVNLLEGGEWQSLDEKGRPKGLEYVSIAANVEADNTAPDGSGRALKLSTIASWASISIPFKNNFKGGGMTFYLKGDTPLSFEAHGGSVVNMPNTRIPVGNDWYLYRVIIPQGDFTRLRIFFLWDTNSAKTTFISGMKLSPYKAVPLPHYDPNNYCKGSVKSIPTAGVWRVGEFVMNTNDVANPDVAGWRCTSIEPLTFKPF